MGCLTLLEIGTAKDDAKGVEGAVGECIGAVDDATASLLLPSESTRPTSNRGSTSTVSLLTDARGGALERLFEGSDLFMLIVRFLAKNTF